MAKFIVNPGGITHSVPDEDADRILAQRDSFVPSRGDFRFATDAEITEWHKAQGLKPPAPVADASDDKAAADAKAAPESNGKAA